MAMASWKRMNANCVKLGYLDVWEMEVETQPERQFT